MMDETIEITIKLTVDSDYTITGMETGVGGSSLDRRLRWIAETIAKDVHKATVEFIKAMNNATAMSSDVKSITNELARLLNVFSSDDIQDAIKSATEEHLLPELPDEVKQLLDKLGDSLEDSDG